MDLEDNLENRLSDPEFCRALLAELQEVIAENERLRRALRDIKRLAALDELVDQAQELDMGY